MVVNRFEIWLAALDPTLGKEIKKTRPCLIISPDEMNPFLDTVMIIPLTSTIRDFPTRVNCVFQNKKGQLAIDQMRAIDKQRLIKKLGTLRPTTCRTVTDLLHNYFDH